METLLEAGRGEGQDPAKRVNIDHKAKGSGRGRTALHCASALGREDLVRLLLGKGHMLS